MKHGHKTTTVALAILHKRYYAGRPERLTALEEARTADEVAREKRERKHAPAAKEVLDLEDVDPKTLPPKEGTVTHESVIRAIRADRDAR